MSELQEKILLVKQACEANNLTVDTSMILDCATRLHISEKISSEKNNRPPFTPNRTFAKPYTPTTSDGASEKQIAMIKRLGFVGNLDQLNKSKASEIINQLMLARQNQQT